MKKYGKSVRWLACCLLVATTRAPGADLRVMTLDDPPFSMQADNGQIAGMSTELVREMFRRAHISYSLERVPWLRALNTSLLENNTCVYSTARTAGRENQFKWVGPLLVNPWVLYAGPTSPGKIFSLDEARRYRISSYSGAAIAQYLVAQGFDVDLAPTDDQSARKLAAGRVEFWATGKYRGKYICEQDKLSQLKPVLEFGAVLQYLACNRGVPDVTILRLNQTLAKMQADGFSDRVRNSYLRN